MSLDIALSADRLSKVYLLYSKPIDRLKQMIFRGRRQYFREFSALSDVSFSLQRGQVLGLVGRNGAGKSTLLQLICKTLTPSSGSVVVNGRVAALLELGAGFNPDFTGRENVYLNASILGLGRAEIDERYDEIVAFSGIGDFINQPVKTYSSGMYVRLAFAIATSVDPDILVIDEALSVGDGAFARKSFDRIMALRERGATILFCSHSLYQVEAFCDQVIWLERGQVAAQGEPAIVIPRYQRFLDKETAKVDGGAVAAEHVTAGQVGRARILTTWVCVNDGPADTRLQICNGEDTLQIRLRFMADKTLPVPTVAVTFHLPDGRMIASAGNWVRNVPLHCNSEGIGEVIIKFPAFQLLKGEYFINSYLLCEQGIHLYDSGHAICNLEVTQNHIEQGFFSLTQEWIVQEPRFGDILPSEIITNE